MTQKIPCPYCDDDQGPVHRAVLSNGITFDRMTALICIACGEPICLTPTGFRKPTPDEHVLMAGDERLGIARTAWLELKSRKGETPPIHALWSRYRDERLRGDLKVENFKTDSDLMYAAQDIFTSGVALALALFQENLNNSDSSEDFSARMMIIDAELKVLNVMRIEEEEPDGRSTSQGSVRRRKRSGDRVRSA